jgi:hypothetical protein
MALQIGGNCHYHPMRAGIGVCVECRQVICVECTTQFDGINRCAACLGKMSRSASRKAAGSDFRLASLAALLTLFGAVFAVVFWSAHLLVP